MRIEHFVKIEPVKDNFKDIEIYDTEEDEIDLFVGDILKKTEDKKESFPLSSDHRTIKKDITNETKTHEFIFKSNKNIKELFENSNNFEKMKKNISNNLLDDEWDGYEAYVSVDSVHENDNDGYKNDISLDEIDFEDK